MTAGRCMSCCSMPALPSSPCLRCVACSISLHQMQVRDRPIFHVAPPSGWANGPNEPLFWQGRYHLFYQHVPSTTKWGWGLCWGHASSGDLVHWQHHPPALCPTPGGLDADGCFSGCAVVVPRQQVQAAAPGLVCAAHTQRQQQQQQQDHHHQERRGSSGCPAVPVLLYTGVVRRPGAPAGLRPSSLAVSELCYEQQLAAVAADPDDPFLTNWVKLKAPVCRETPPGLCLNCFRDPFVLERPSLSNNSRWRVMVGAGIREPVTGLACAGPPPIAAPESKPDGTAEAAAAARSAVQTPDGAGTVLTDAAAARRAARGTVLVYSTDNLLSGWQYEGLLCTARDGHPDGPVWECPLLVQLPAPATAATAPQHAPSNTVSGTDNVSSSGSSSSGSSSSGQAGGQQSDKDTYMFSVSVGKSPAIYWTGAYSGGRFELGQADGPHPLDLGDLLYAPNVLTDVQGHTILWAWLSELPAPASHSQDYAGSLCLPHLLSRGPGGTLHQTPLPQLQQLATQPAWQADSLVLPGPGVAIRHVASEVPWSYFSLSLTLAPASTPSSTGPETAGAAAQGVQLVGFLLPAYSFTAEAPDSSHGSGASAGDGVCAVSSSGQGLVVLYDFSSCNLSVVAGPGVGADILQVDSDRQSTDGLTSALQQYISGASTAGMAAAVGVRVLGGKLHLSPGQPLELQAYMDHTLFELFVAGCGQTLGTRVYRRTDSQSGGQVSSSCSAVVEAVPGGVWLLSAGQQGVEAQGVRLAAMQSIWR